MILTTCLASGEGFSVLSHWDDRFRVTRTIIWDEEVEPNKQYLISLQPTREDV